MKRLKKSVSYLLAACLLMAICSSFVAGFAKTTAPSYDARSLMEHTYNPLRKNPPKGKTYQIKRFYQLARYTDLGYNYGKEGPIILTKATLRQGGEKRSVYLITLSGLEMPTVRPQATNLVTVLLVSRELQNDYVSNVIKTMKKAIPKGASVILAGHSLGGMVAQEVAANRSVQKRYQIDRVVTWGSPVQCPNRLNGKLTRLGDVSDVIPALSDELPDAPLQKEDGGYEKNDILFRAHITSYCRKDVWQAYDALGIKNGSAKIVLDLTTQHFYHCPFAFMQNE